MRIRSALAGIAVITLLFASASWAAAAAGWTPTQAAAVLASPSTKIYDVAAPQGAAYASAPIKGWFSAAQCNGLGKALAGVYSAFSCSATPTLTRNPAQTFFVRIWSATSACVTKLNLGSCPPPLPAKPLPNDPRNCVTTNNGYAACMLFAAFNAMLQTAETTGSGNILGVHCQATGSWTVYACTWGRALEGVLRPETGLVRFLSAPRGWTIKATIN